MEKDKKLVHDLNYDGIKFSIPKEDFRKIEMKNNIDINVYFQKFENSWVCC